MTRKLPVEVRFWSKVEVRGIDECWPWTGALQCGYGWFAMRPDNPKKASRVAFFLTYGWWPLVVRHSCDSPPCCNPRHLLAGTQADNNRDARERGRAKLNYLIGDFARRLSFGTEQAIKDEYARGGVTQRALAQRYGVDHSTICRALRR